MKTKKFILITLIDVETGEVKYSISLKKSHFISNFSFNKFNDGTFYIINHLKDFVDIINSLSLCELRIKFIDDKDYSLYIPF